MEHDCNKCNGRGVCILELSYRTVKEVPESVREYEKASGLLGAKEVINICDAFVISLVKYIAGDTTGSMVASISALIRFGFMLGKYPNEAKRISSLFLSEGPAIVKDAKSITRKEPLSTTNFGIKVRCNQCKWTGDFLHLKAVQVKNPLDPTDTVGELSCPACGSVRFLETAREN
jgi:hypothetical protein